jgi:hypothetical protein
MDTVKSVMLPLYEIVKFGSTTVCDWLSIVVAWASPETVKVWATKNPGSIKIINRSTDFDTSMSNDDLVVVIIFMVFLLD